MQAAHSKALTQQQVRRGLECLRRMSQETQDAISAAESALQQNDWTSLSATKRGKLLHRLADLLEKKSHHFAQLDTLDSGKPILGNYDSDCLYSRILPILWRIGR